MTCLAVLPISLAEGVIVEGGEREARRVRHAEMRAPVRAQNERTQSCKFNER